MPDLSPPSHRPLSEVPTSELLVRLRWLEDVDAPWEDSAEMREELGRRPFYQQVMSENAERSRRREILRLDGSS